MNLYQILFKRRKRIEPDFDDRMKEAEDIANAFYEAGEKVYRISYSSITGQTIVHTTPPPKVRWWISEDGGDSYKELNIAAF